MISINTKFKSTNEITFINGGKKSTGDVEGVVTKVKPRNVTVTSEDGEEYIITNAVFNDNNEFEVVEEVVAEEAKEAAPKKTKKTNKKEVVEEVVAEQAKEDVEQVKEETTEEEVAKPKVVKITSKNCLDFYTPIDFGEEVTRKEQVRYWKNQGVSSNAIIAILTGCNAAYTQRLASEIKNEATKIVEVLDEEVAEEAIEVETEEQIAE